MCKGGKKMRKKNWKEILNSFDATGRVVNVSIFSWERCYQEVPRELFLCSASTCQLIIRYWIDQSESRRKILELSGSLLEKLRCSHFRSGFRRVQVVTLFLRVFTFRLIFLLILRRLTFFPSRDKFSSAFDLNSLTFVLLYYLNSGFKRGNFFNMPAALPTKVSFKTIFLFSYSPSNFKLLFSPQVYIIWAKYLHIIMVKKETVWGA